jgi:hypothetical protein
LHKENDVKTKVTPNGEKMIGYFDIRDMIMGKAKGYVDVDRIQEQREPTTSQ